MVELDNLLGGGPVQHREDQGEESQLFVSYFPSGMNMYFQDAVLFGGKETVTGDHVVIVCCVTTVGTLQRLPISVILASSKQNFITDYVKVICLL